MAEQDKLRAGIDEDLKMNDNQKDTTKHAEQLEGLVELDTLLKIKNNTSELYRLKRMADNIDTIKSCVMFFTILTIVFIVIGIIVFFMAIS